MNESPGTRYAIRDTKTKAILFDLGETLLSFGRVEPGKIFRQGAKRTYEYLSQLGKSVGDFKHYCRRNLTTIRIWYWLSFATGKDFDTLKLLKKINVRKGIELAENQWRHLVWLWYEPLSKVAGAEPDITQTLTKLKQMSLKLGILSNTFINGCALDKHLEQFGLLDFFEVRLYSYQFGFRKPDKRIFKAAAEKIGAKPEEIVFVGDRIDKDIRPAMKVGMTAVLKQAFTNHGKRLPVGAFSINRISELPALIEQIDLKR